MKIETVTTALAKVQETQGKVDSLAVDLTLLALALAVVDAEPKAEWFHMAVTDQGGNHMTPGDVETTDGQVHDLEELFDELWELTAALTDHQIEHEAHWEHIGTRHSGVGRLNIPGALADLTRKYEGLIGEIESPFPDPSDTAALLAWLSET